MRRLLPVLALLAAAACADDLLPDSEISLMAEASPVQRDSLIPLRISNPTSSRVYVPACGGVPSVVVERRAPSGAWESYGGSICLANVPMTPIPVEARTDRRFTFAVRDTGEFRASTRTLGREGRGPARTVVGMPFRVR